MEHLQVDGAIAAMSMGKTFRIGLNMLYLRPGKVGGGETYARGLLKGLQELGTPFEYFVFLNADAWATFEYLDRLPNFHRISCRNPLNPGLRHLWEQVRFSSICKDHRLDLLHSLGNVSPLVTSCGKAVTIHDLLWNRQPDRLATMRRLLYRFLSPLSARLCDGVFTVSDHSKRDISEVLRIPSSRLYLTTEGPGQEFPAPADWNIVKEKYKIPDQFFLSVGTDRHKRLDVTLDAIKSLRKNQVNAHLVVAGERAASSRFLNSNGEVRWLGHIPASELISIYKHAIALVCSSELEGFGLPVLEAMTVGTPVIATDRGSLPQVVGKGGVLVECGDANELAATMDKLIREPQWRAHLAQHGLQHAETFSWQLCAMATVNGYEDILRRRGVF